MFRPQSPLKFDGGTQVTGTWMLVEQYKNKWVLCSPIFLRSRLQWAHKCYPLPLP